MSGPKTATLEVMPVDVFRGGGGHIVLCQEWSTEKGETYLRIQINERDAEKIAMRILAVAEEVRGK